METEISKAIVLGELLQAILDVRRKLESVYGTWGYTAWADEVFDEPLRKMAAEILSEIEHLNGIGTKQAQG